MTKPLNFDALKELTGESGELQDSLIALYEVTAERCITMLESLVENDDDERWHGVAHELKGASGSIRAEEMAALCRQIEYLPFDPDERKRACELLRESLVEFKAFVEKAK
ncbi:MAG: Hpt domain-containing protein [Rickettsiales bacterium]